MPTSSQPRISVYRQDRMVPLLPGLARRQPQPWQGVLLERHIVGAIEIPEHDHHTVCLHLQLAGTPDLEWWSEGQNRIEHTAPGSLILLDNGTRDRLRWSAHSERLVASIRAEAFARAAEHLGAPPTTFANRWTLRDPALANALLAMAREAEAGFPLGRLFADLLELELATTLLRRHAAAPALHPRSGGLPLPLIRRVLEFINANLARDLPLADIAAVAALSDFHFARAFRATTGQTVHQYVLDQRIAEAERLLSARSLPLGEIALRAGGGCASNVARVFRRRVGLSPSAWSLHTWNQPTPRARSASHT